MLLRSRSSFHIVNRQGTSIYTEYLIGFFLMVFNSRGALGGSQLPMDYPLASPSLIRKHGPLLTTVCRHSPDDYMSILNSDSELTFQSRCHLCRGGGCNPASSSEGVDRPSYRAPPNLVTDSGDTPRAVPEATRPNAHFELVASSLLSRIQPLPLVSSGRAAP
jgi:hypothetical protein